MLAAIIKFKFACSKVLFMCVCALKKDDEKIIRIKINKQVLG